MFRFRLSLALALWLVATALSGNATANEVVEAKTVRVVTIGASFTRNTTRYLGELASARGHVLVHRPVVVAASSLKSHAEMARRHAEDPTDKTGLYSNGRSLKQELQSAEWDFVTIQESSSTGHDLTGYQPYAGQLAELIRAAAPKAKLLLFETWEYRSDDPRFANPAKPKPGVPATQQAMYEGVSQAYRHISAELGVSFIPVGDAFHLANSDEKWAYRRDERFDFKTAQPPMLPDQTHSLHVGWHWKNQPNGSQVLQYDGRHAGPAGQYLGSCVFYEVLFGEDARDNPFVPPELAADYARYLRETAHRAVAQVAKDR